MKRSEWAGRWLDKAENDLEAAKIMRREGIFDTCSFLCQQAAEKAIKALWIDIRQTDPPRIHAVGPMAAQLGAGREIVCDINDVVGDYMASRYPDAAVAMSVDYYTDVDAEERLTKTERVLSWVVSQWETENES